MYKRISMKADYEPWWNFEDIEEKYTDVQHFTTLEDYERDAEQILTQYRKQFQHEQNRDSRYYAFWNEEEKEYCEGCDEDLQIYYGLIFSHPIGILTK